MLYNFYIVVHLCSVFNVIVIFNVYDIIPVSLVGIKWIQQHSLLMPSLLQFMVMYIDLLNHQQFIKWGQVRFLKKYFLSHVSSYHQMAAVSTIVNRGTPLKAYVFRNYNLQPGVRSHYLGGCEHKLWQAVRASSAAPGYFQEFALGHDLHQVRRVLETLMLCPSQCSTLQLPPILHIFPGLAFSLSPVCLPYSTSFSLILSS